MNHSTSLCHCIVISVSGTTFKNVNEFKSMAEFFPSMSVQSKVVYFNASVFDPEMDVQQLVILIFSFDCKSNNEHVTVLTFKSIEIETDENFIQETIQGGFAFTQAQALMTNKGAANSRQLR